MNRPQGQAWGSVGVDRGVVASAWVTLAEFKKFARIARKDGLTFSAALAALMREAIEHGSLWW